MNDFNSLYMCSFEPTIKNDLVDRIVEYYKKTEHMDNRDALKERKELSLWCEYHGYTSDDYNKAKKIASGMRH